LSPCDRDSGRALSKALEKSRRQLTRADTGEDIAVPGIVMSAPLTRRHRSSLFLSLSPSFSLSLPLSLSLSLFLSRFSLFLSLSQKPQRHRLKRQSLTTPGIAAERASGYSRHRRGHHCPCAPETQTLSLSLSHSLSPSDTDSLSLSLSLSLSVSPGDGCDRAPEILQEL
jgi:hypothetical protein